MVSTAMGCRGYAGCVSMIVSVLTLEVSQRQSQEFLGEE
jgi:hypothetical protein